MLCSEKLMDGWTGEWILLDDVLLEKPFQKQLDRNNNNNNNINIIRTIFKNLNKFNFVEWKVKKITDSLNNDIENNTFSSNCKH